MAARHKLTARAVEQIANGQQVPQPVLQVIDVKQIQSPNAAPGASQRYRLVISDGTHFQQGMLATQLNTLIQSGQLAPRCIIKLNEYMCNTVQNRKIVIILNMDVLSPPLDATIGNPSYLDPSAAGDAKPQQQQQQPAQRAQPPQQQQQQRAQPQQQQQQQRSNAFAGIQQVDGHTIIPIKDLHPYQNRWSIKARVTSKSDKRSFNNQRGPGSFFKIDLLDSSGGEISCTFFNQACEKFFNEIEEGRVYIISGGSIKYANKKFNNLKNTYEITCDTNSTVLPCNQGEEDIPDIQYHFVDIADIESRNKDDIIDVLGVILEVGDLDNFVSKAGAALSKRVIWLGDASRHKVNLTLWGEKAEQYNAHEEGVLAVKTVKVSDFNGRSLTASRFSVIMLNPNIEEARKLQQWYDGQGGGADFRSISSESSFQRTGDGASRPSMWNGKRRCAIDMTDEQLEELVAAKQESFVMEGLITFIKHNFDQPPWYAACPAVTQSTTGRETHCNKKMDFVSGKWHCPKPTCGLIADRCTYRYVLSLKSSDHTGCTWLNAFDEVGNDLLGQPAENLVALKEEGRQAEFEEVFKKALFTRCNMAIRAQRSEYENTTRIKSNVNRIQKVDYATASADLIRRIGAHGHHPRA